MAKEARVVQPTIRLAQCKRTWDAIVVGAGPAGSVAGRELARRKLRVLLVDQAQFPRTKVCGSCLNGFATAALDQIGLGSLPAQLGAIPLKRVTLTAGAHRADVAFSDGVSLSRTALDAALIEAAKDAGAEFLPGVRATMDECVGDVRRLTLKSADESMDLEAKVVIIADGLNGRTSPHTSTVDAKARLGAGTILPQAPANLPPGQLIMAAAKHGYVGLVRLEDDQLDIAAAFDARFVRDCGGLAQAAMAVLKEAGVSEIEGLEQANWKGTPALTRRPEQIAGERWFAVGDAAGYIEPFTGEGMAWAIAGAVALAELAAKPWHPSCTEQWTSTHSRVVGRRQASCRRLARLLRHPLMCRWLVRVLAVCPALASPFTHDWRGQSKLNPLSIGGAT
jgi:menaquinone-9 beta-reductase